MAGISPEALCALDVEWYGLDALGQVAVFCSGGTGIVPDFVCADQEKQERLVELSDELPANSETVLHFVPSKKNPLPVRVAQGFPERFFSITMRMTDPGQWKTSASCKAIIPCDQHQPIRSMFPICRLLCRHCFGSRFFRYRTFLSSL